MGLGGIKAALRGNNLFRRVLAVKLKHKYVRIPHPTRLIFEPISACNYRCPKCVYPEMVRPKTATDIGKFTAFLKSWRDVYGPFQTIEFTGAGEVLLMRDFPDLVQAASDIMPDTALMTTSNLSLLNAELGAKLLTAGLRSWQISLDSADNKEYAVLMGIKSASLDKVVGNIKLLWSLMANDASPRNKLTVVAHRPYDAQYLPQLKLIEDLVTGYCHHIEKSPYQTLNGRKTAEQFTLSEKELYTSDRYNLPCAYPWTDLVAVNDGTVRVCCSDMFDSPVNLGNIFTDTPQQIVANANRQNYQQHMLTGDMKPLYLCNKCHAPKG